MITCRLLCCCCAAALIAAWASMVSAQRAEIEERLVQSVAGWATEDQLWAIEQTIGWIACAPTMLLYGMGILVKLGYDQAIGNLVQWTRLVAASALEIPLPTTQMTVTSMTMSCTKYAMGIIASHAKEEASKALRSRLSSFSMFEMAFMAVGICAVSALAFVVLRRLLRFIRRFLVLATVFVFVIGQLGCGKVTHSLVHWTYMVAAPAAGIPVPVTQTEALSMTMRSLWYGMRILANQLRAEMATTMMPSLSLVISSAEEMMNAPIHAMWIVLFVCAACATAFVVVRQLLRVVVHICMMIVFLFIGAIDRRLGFAIFAAWYVAVPAMRWLRRAVSWIVRSVQFVKQTEHRRLALIAARSIVILPLHILLWTLGCIWWVVRRINTILCYVLPGYGLFCSIVCMIVDIVCLTVRLFWNFLVMIRRVVVYMSSVFVQA
jgi:hypothetical protein